MFMKSRLSSWIVFIFAIILPMAAQSAEPGWIFGVHDLGGFVKIEQAGKRGWLVVTKEIGSNPNDNSYDDFTYYSNRGHGVIVRLNNGYGSAGTLPYQSQYANFATRCANYVKNTKGADIFIIGNETNLPREWPGNINGDANTGEAITVARYVDCYNRCYNAIKAVKPTAQVCPTPSGTWAPPYDGSLPPIPNRGVEGFLTYWVNILNNIGASKIDALILHAYTHGCDPAMAYSNQLMGAPYGNIYYHFRVYRNYMANIPSTMRTKPVYITECDQNIECADPPCNPPCVRNTWQNQNNGWMKAMYKEIDDWNKGASTQKIRCLAMFRWDPNNEGEWSFSFSNRNNVVTDWLEAMQNEYRWDTNLKGALSGYVRNTSGQGISGATVTTSVGGYSATTSASGFYSISNVLQGTYDITATKSGYVASTQTGKTVTSAQTTTVNFSLNPVVSLQSAKQAPNGAVVGVEGVVTGKFQATGQPQRIYIKNTAKSCGIGLDSSASVDPGDLVQVQGTTTLSSGERIINASSVVKIGTQATPSPFAMNNQTVGGGAFGAQPPLLNYSTANSYSTGLNNVGLLVRTWGKVTSVDSANSVFYIDDGSNLRDGSGSTGIRVDCRNLPLPTHNSNITVAGISGVTQIGGINVRLLRPRSASDLSYVTNVNMITNSGFELGSLSGWSTYGTVESPHSGTWFGIPPYTGSWFVGNAANGGTKSGGLYQRIAITNGLQYQAKVWSCIMRADNPSDSAQSKIGIDPTGGTNPTSANVRWSSVDTQATDYATVWRQLSTPVVTSAGGYVTVFLDVYQINSSGWHINCFDDAELRISIP